MFGDVGWRWYNPLYLRLARFVQGGVVKTFRRATRFTMKPNPYESTSSESVGPKRNGTMYWLALAVSFFVCAIPAGIAANAWLTHWHWQQTGAYSRNSFPMNDLASDATWVTIGCVAATLCGWAVWAIRTRLRSAKDLPSS